MGSYDNIYFAVGEVFQNGFYFWGFPGSAEVFDTYWELLQSLFEGLVMLEGQYGGRHEYCDLFVVAGP